MKKFYAFLFYISLLATANAQRPVSSYQPDFSSIAKKERAAFSGLHSQASTRSVASQNFDVNFYRCRWEVDPAVRYIKGIVTSYFTMKTPGNSITFDLEASLTVDSVYFRNSKISFVHSANHALTLQLPQTLNASIKDSVTIFYQGVPVDDGFGSFVTYEIDNSPVLWTLSEPYGAKDWWPCKNGNDDKSDSIDIEITYPQAYTSSSNGILTSELINGGRKISYWKHRYPIASYLVAIAVADYAVDNDSVQLASRMMPVKMYAYPSYVSYFKPATALTKNCLQRFSALFGEYPFSKESYSNTQFLWGGGMEHQTNSFITTNGNHLVSHELGHQWFGDRVTCGSWQDIWLNEGFATYMQFIYIQNFEPWQQLAHLSFCKDIITSMPGGALKIPDTTNINLMFDNRITYTKGSYVVHMIRWRLGDSLFFQAIRHYLSDPKITYGFARTADLQRNLEEVSGQSFTEFFKDWYEGEGFPSYHLGWTVNNNNWIKINLNQTTSHPSVSFFEMPVPVLLRQGSRDTTIVLNHTINNQDFWINPGFIPDEVIIDPELWLLSANNTVEKISPATVDNDQVQVFPNPVKDNLHLSFANPTGKKLQVRIINGAGQLVYSHEYEMPGRDENIEIPFRALSKGVYWLQVNSDNGVKVTKKVLK
jgi:aminopeptidase N